MKKALYISLFFNVLFLGIGSGYLLHQLKGPVKQWQLQHQLRNSLSDNGKAHFDEWLAKVEKKPGFWRKRRQIMRILKADEFDQEAFLEASASLKQVHIDQVDRFSKATMALASHLKTEERRLLAKHLPHLARPKRGKHKRPH